MNPPENRFSSEHQQTSGSQRTPTGIRMESLQETDKELAAVSPVFKLLARAETEKPGAAQWRDFSRNLDARLKAETAKGNRRVLQTLRDKLSATDSVAMRLLVYVIAFCILAAAAIGLWLGTALMLEQLPMRPQLTRGAKSNIAVIHQV